MLKNKIRLGFTAIVLLVSATLFTGCSKDSGTPLPEPTGFKLSKIEYDNGDTIKITYNNAGFVQSVSTKYTYSGTSEKKVYQFSYSGNNLTQINVDNGFVYKYSYENNKVAKTDIFNATGEKIAMYVYTYQDGQLRKTDGYNRVPGGGLSTSPTFRYYQNYYPNANLKELIVYLANPITTLLEKTEEYLIETYDNHKNTASFFESSPFLPLDHIVPNNPLIEKHFNGTGQLEETILHSYTYDAAGNPLTRKTTTKVQGAPDQVENTRFTY